MIERGLRGTELVLDLSDHKIICIEALELFEYLRNFQEATSKPDLS